MTNTKFFNLKVIRGNTPSIFIRLHHEGEYRNLRLEDLVSHAKANWSHPHFSFEIYGSFHNMTVDLKLKEIIPTNDAEDLTDSGYELTVDGDSLTKLIEDRDPLDPGYHEEIVYNLLLEYEDNVILKLFVPLSEKEVEDRCDSRKNKAMRRLEELMVRGNDPSYVEDYYHVLFQDRNLLDGRFSIQAPSIAIPSNDSKSATQFVSEYLLEENLEQRILSGDLLLLSDLKIPKEYQVPISELLRESGDRHSKLYTFYSFVHKNWYSETEIHRVEEISRALREAILSGKQFIPDPQGVIGFYTYQIYGCDRLKDSKESSDFVCEHGWYTCRVFLIDPDTDKVVSIYDPSQITKMSLGFTISPISSSMLSFIKVGLKIAAASSDSRPPVATGVAAVAAIATIADARGTAMPDLQLNLSLPLKTFISWNMSESKRYKVNRLLDLILPFIMRILNIRGKFNSKFSHDFIQEASKNSIPLVDFLYEVYSIDTEIAEKLMNVMEFNTINFRNDLTRSLVLKTVSS